MDQQCIFCGIASGSIPSKKIFEDDKVTVVLDIYPANPAHLLVLTKAHHAIFNQLSKEEAEHIGIICKRISELMFKVLKPEGINFFIANGAVAGQKAPHMILHAIPRFSGDGLKFDIPFSPVKEEELDAFHEKLKPTLKNYFPDVDFDKTAEAIETSQKEEPAEENAVGKMDKENKDEVQEEANAAKETEAGREEPEKKDDINLDKITEMFS